MSIKEEKIHGFSALMHLAERICGVKHKRFLLAPRVCRGAYTVFLRARYMPPHFRPLKVRTQPWTGCCGPSKMDVCGTAGSSFI